ncbi:MAG: S1 RNA-binding domain-containing protein [Caldiserica bacterium]|nr:S1 RNA-binding domain-containing protein [Caldisericota bacterium]
MEEKGIFENVNFDDVKTILEQAEVKKLPRSEHFEETSESAEKIAEAENVEQQVQSEQNKAEAEKKENETHDSKSEKSRDILKNSNEFFPKLLRRGDVISVTVVKLESNGIMVSAGRKEDHFIPTHGLSLRPVNSPEEVVKIGDKIDVLVMKDGDNENRVVLSKKMADYVKKWQELKSKFERVEIVQGLVVKAIKGGLLIDIDGITAFLPQSQIGLRKGETVESFVNKTLEFHILEINQSIKRIIVSRLKVLSELKEKEKKMALVSLKKGEIYGGVVRSVQDFGVFVDIGNGIEGLIRVNELTWGRRKPPQEIIKIGETIKVKVISVNLDTGKVGLSLRQTKPYPWDDVESKFPVDSTVEGIVIRIHPFGAVVELDDGLTGLIHISQLDVKRVNKVEDIVKIGDRVQAKVIAIDKENKKIKLSRKALLENQ